MQSHDLRRLVTTFLVLALLAGSSTLAITSIARQRSEGPAALARNAAKELESQVPKIGDKALVEALPSGASEGYDLAKEFSPTITQKDNYTDTLAKGLAYEFVTQNPEGPQEGFGITAPSNLDGIMDEYVMEAALAPTTYAIDESKLKIARTYTPEQVETYLTTVEEAFSGAAGESGLSKITARAAENTVDDAALQASSFIISDAQEQIYGAVAPGPAEDFHRSLLTYLELNRKLAELEYSTDPLKAAVFAAKYPELELRESTKLAKAAENLEKSAPEMLAQAKNPFRISALLGVEQAHAIIVKDIGHIIVSILNGTAQFGSWGQLIAKVAREIATQIIKNQLIGRMVQQTIKWVQGGGKPQFITNWKKFLTDAATGAADIALSRIAPQLCSSFGSRATSLSRVYATSGANQSSPAITCTLNRVVQNIRDLYSDFRNGGWLGFLMSSLPQNNLWGSVLLASGQMQTEAMQAAGTAEAEASANKGYKGLQRCVNYSTEVVPESQISSLQKSGSFVGLGPRGCFTQVNSVPNPYFQEWCAQNPADCTDPDQENGSERVRMCEVKLCKPDGKQTTTPGGAVAEQVEKSLGASVDNIVNAHDLAGLVGVIVDAAITRLIGMAERGLLGLFGGDGGSDTGGGGGGGGTTGTSTPPDSGISGLKAQAGVLLSALTGRVTGAIADAASWAGLSSQAKTLLRSVAMTCTSRAAEANARADSIDRVTPANETDAAAAAALETRINQLRAAVEASNDAIEIADLVSQIDTLSTESSTLLTRITTRKAQISGLRDAAQANLDNRACNVELPAIDE